MATRMPFPPPPAAALIITGNPISRATARASSNSSISPSEPGTVGTPTSIMVRRAVALSPMARIWSAVGPTKTIPDRWQISLNSGFSARNPYPGWMASAPVISAAAMMRVMSR